MRCKNCGCENDDNLYICQNCGSPLYDENGEIQGGESGTQVFGAVGNDDLNQYDDYEDEELKQRREQREARRAEKQAAAAKKKKQEIIIIVVLAILLIAIIIGTIIAIAHSKKVNETTTLSTETSTSETVETTAENTTEYTTEKTTYETTTEEESTTEEETTEEQTSAPTQKTQYSVSLSSNDGGEVEGPSSAAAGDTVTVIARPSDGYDFAGWYVDGSLVSSSASFSFTADENTSLQAKFVPVDNGNNESGNNNANSGNNAKNNNNLNGQDDN